MTFSNPSGLWLLAGIPLLLLLYLLRPRYEEKRVSSIFLWKLSVKYRQQHRLAARMRSLSVLGLQIMLILVSSLMAAQPILANADFGRDMVVILDTSCSMRMRGEDGESMLSKAKRQILSLADQVHYGNSMTLLTTNPEQNCLVERCRSVQEIRTALSKAECTWDAGSLDAALAAAQEKLRIYPDAKVWYYTDHQVTEFDHVQVINCAENHVRNAALLSMKATALSQGMIFESTVIHYGGEAKLTLGLFVDDALVAAQQVDCPPDETVEVKWYLPGLKHYQKARVSVEDEDALPEDNSFTLFQQPAQTQRIVVVSQKPFYLEKAFQAFAGCQAEIYSYPWEAPNSGRDIYIYDGCLPEKLPVDGAAWIINPPDSAEVFGLELGGMLQGGYLARTAEVLREKRLSDILEGLSCRDTAVLRLREVLQAEGMIVLARVGNAPAILAGYTDAGAPLILLPFDLHASNLPLQTDYLCLIDNLMRFSLPQMLETLCVEAGSPVRAEAIPFCRRGWLETPDGEIRELTLLNNAFSFSPGEPGAWRIGQEADNGAAQTVSFHVQVPLSESGPEQAEPESLYLVRPERAEGEKQSDGMELHLILAALMLAILTFECVVYNRERV